MAVYQDYSPKASSSNWLFLQPSEQIANILSEKVRSSKGSKGPSLLSYDFASSLNLAILVSTETEWGSYINYLELEINAMVRVLIQYLLL